MKPGKNPIGTPELDLEKLWRTLKEDPPGSIHTLEPRKPDKEAKQPSGNSSRG